MRRILIAVVAAAALAVAGTAAGVTGSTDSYHDSMQITRSYHDS